MPSRVRIATGRRPVSIAVGFLDPPPKKLKQLRKQVVVAVTADWTIMCFDHNLKLLWENNVQEDFPHHASIREVAVLITNHTVNKGDRGMVVVGGSIDLGDLLAQEDPLTQELEAEVNPHHSVRRYPAYTEPMQPLSTAPSRASYT